MKVCDVTQFYAPRSGGVKRYLHAKIRHIQSHRSGDAHVLIVPGDQTRRRVNERSRVYSIHSPSVSRSTGYRALVNLRAVSEIIEKEQPHIIESADPYQLGWHLAAVSRVRRIAAVAFYHSDFANAYLRPAAERLGRGAASLVMQAAQNYTRRLYNQFEVTLVPSEALALKLREWGVRDVRVVPLGVDMDVFNSESRDDARVRTANNIPEGATLLMYVGRLAGEKNTRVLFDAFEALVQRQPGRFHLLVVGDGQERTRVTDLQGATAAVTWLPYCEAASELAQLYRAADLFVHPGTQETFGLVALESQACGTPVIGIKGSAMDGLILHDQSAWADMNSPEALADAIERAAALNFRAMGVTAAGRVAERYSWASVFEHLFAIYAEVQARYKQRAAA